MIGAIGMGVREAQFYSDVAGTIALPVPRCAYAGAEGDLFVLLLEDLASRGCRFSDGRWGVSADAAARALEDLAGFHARFEKASERDAVAPWLRAPNRGPGSAATAGLMRWVLDQHAASLSPAYRTIGELYVQHHAWFDETWNAGPETYVHGDLHVGNVFLDGDRVGFIDWGLSRTSTHLRDVSYFLTMSVDVEERRGNERALLQTYLDALRSAGGSEMHLDDAWQAHRRQASYTVVATFLAYMPSYAAGDGVGLGKSLLARAEAALGDLDVVDAIRAVL
jgi:aminoglycoside phosphotransferase (APT) family kinase protein